MAELELTAHYADYYRSRPSEWREICARGKARNIVDLWTRASLSPRSPRVLEIGCGDGALLNALDQAEFGVSYQGWDISSSAIECAERRHLGRPVDWRCIMPGALELPDDSTDLAVLSHVIEHVADPRGLIAEALRVARYVYIEVPLEDTWFHERHFRWTDVGHINFYSSNTLRWLVESAIAPVATRVIIEEVTSQHPDVFEYRYGRAKGRLYATVKSALLKAAPALASRLLTYHGSLVATRHTH